MQLSQKDLWRIILEVKRILHLASGKRVGRVTPLVAAGATHEYEMQLAEYVVRQLPPHLLDLALYLSLSLSASHSRALAFRY